MLADSILLPSALSAEAPGIETLLLQDLEEAGVVLITEKGVLDRYDGLLDRWPESLRTEAKKRLVLMRKRGQVIGLHASADHDCGDCAALSKLGRSLGVRFSFCHLPCCANFAPPGVPIDTADYPTSEYREWVATSRSLVLADGELVEHELADRVLRPVFKWAKRVTLIDRNIARSGLSDRFRTSLRWIAIEYARACRMPNKLFRIVTSMEARASEGVLDAALHSFIPELEGLDSDLRIEVQVFRDRPSAEMSHDRYLVTNQIALSFGRGFDLLGARKGAGREVRDVNINRLQTSPDQVETAHLKVLGYPELTYGNGD